MTNRTFSVIALVLLATIASVTASGRGGWTSAQLEELRLMSLAELEPLPRDPTNRAADDPRAAALGRRLFHETRLSSNGRVACGTCHQAERGFQDGIALANGVGKTARRTMPIAGMARAPFLFWDGRKDSLWAQALGPLESPVEHGGTRAQYAHVVADFYARDYEAVFGALPDLSRVPRSAGPVADPEAAAAWNALSRAQQDEVTRVFVNIGKAIAAFERRIDVGASRFDKYVAAVTSGQSDQNILTDDEVAGLRLFIGKANCTQCHSGPLFTNNEFHNTGVPPRAELAVDHGRLTGATAVLSDEFNCRSRWSDARERCSELEYMVSGDHTLDRAYKVPSLRNVAERAPYMDAGQFATLADVLDHYNRAPSAPTGHSELRPLRLKPLELRQLEAFLRTLSGPVIVREPAAAMPTR
ncbi:MAG TPA: cytochrome c peroxidase [Vicinamibacterales bacterium]